MPKGRELRVGCFKPLGGLVGGFVLGWGIHMLVVRPGRLIDDIATRFLMLVLGVVGWAAGVVLDKRKLHCGGAQELDAAASARYRWLGPVSLSLLVLSAALVNRGSWEYGLYFFLIFVLLVLLVGEIGWGDPKRIFQILVPWRGR